MERGDRPGQPIHTSYETSLLVTRYSSLITRFFNVSILDQTGCLLASGRRSCETTNDLSLILFLFHHREHGDHRDYFKFSFSAFSAISAVNKRSFLFDQTGCPLARGTRS